MTDVVLDTGALGDLLAQYFSAEDRTVPSFSPSKRLPAEIVEDINRIVRSEGRRFVAASAFAFVEMARKWDEIVVGAFEPYQLAAFLHSPPAWFLVEPVDADLLPFLAEVPPEVIMPGGESRQIEGIDAIHAATALSRWPCQLVTTDQRLMQVMKGINDRRTADRREQV